MFTSAELIEALRRRTRRSLRPETPPGEFPPGWHAWFVSMREHVGAIAGASADAIVALLALRVPRMPPSRLPQLNSPQAFAALWRQQWLPASRDERAQRIAAFAIALLLQVFFSIALLYLAYARFGGEPPARQGEDVVQVEFIGEGSPQEQGGGAAAGPVATPASAASAKPPASAAASARAAASAARAAASEAAPEGEAPSPPAPATPQQAQPVQVSESAAPEPVFALPPPSEREVAVPQAQAQVHVPQLAQAPESLRAVEMPSPLPAKPLVPKLPGAHVEVPALQNSVEALPAPAQPLQGVAQREAHVRAAQVSVPALGASPESLPASAAPLPGISERSVSLPQAKIGVPGLHAQAESLPGTVGAGAQASSTPGASATGAAVSGAATVAGGAAASSGGASAANAGAGAGPKTNAAPGAWSTARPGDDWGASDRNRAGAQSGTRGLFDENGRPRLAPGTSAAAGGGLPPGMIEEDIQDLDRAGTWLKRKNPLPYAPTAFDRYWLPGETLLQEWVRRGIREVQIPIPGTSKKIHCVVSLLQLGGGCGIDDPDMQDQEAKARKPPDVPFKPELQEK